MMLNLLSDTLSWGDRLNYMGIGVLMGIVVIFAVLALLWLILEVFGAVARRGQEAPAKPKVQTPAPVVETPAAPVQQTAPMQQAPSAGDDEIVAAITAALAVYLEEAKASSHSINGFRVVSFKKVGTAAHWNQN
ncbi:MAG: OadG family protein [Clostridia bacterium]|nr:OadG family protein [Clostridia bacterium]